MYFFTAFCCPNGPVLATLHRVDCGHPGYPYHGQEPVPARAVRPGSVGLRVAGPDGEPGENRRPASQPALDQHGRERQARRGERGRRGGEPAGAAARREIRVHQRRGAPDAARIDAGHIPDGDRGRAAVRRGDRGVSAHPARQPQLEPRALQARWPGRFNRLNQPLARPFRRAVAATASASANPISGCAAPPDAHPPAPPLELRTWTRTGAGLVELPRSSTATCAGSKAAWTAAGWPDRSNCTVPLKPDAVVVWMRIAMVFPAGSKVRPASSERVAMGRSAATRMTTSFADASGFAACPYTYGSARAESGSFSGSEG